MKECKFNIGDKVVFDIDLPDNQHIIQKRGIENLNKGVLTVVNVYNLAKSIDLDSRVFMVDSSCNNWPTSRFKLAKNQIVRDIINDL